MIVFEEAVTNKDGTMTFYANNADYTSSLLPLEESGVKKFCETIHHPLLITNSTYEVKCVKLKTFMNREKIDHIDFLKIDTQGQDFEVVKSLEDYITKVKKILLEVQTADYDVYQNQSKEKELMEYMEKYNFILLNTEHTCENLEANLLFENTKYGK
jgi:FkbM family methyltransferase